MEVHPKSGYLSYVRVRFNECDPLGHVNNAVYLTYLEQAAIDHASTVGWPQQRLQKVGHGVFVARRHEIDFLLPAQENDLLRIMTWPVDMGAAKATRAYEITRIAPESDELRDDRLISPDEIVARSTGARILAARTTWAYLDPVAGKIRRIPSAVRDDFVTTLR